ncbi:MAG: hypothetical protein GKR87_00755 [Kiritimatiellae bacterium]|nr:hypothetical protein [Kiritimatiellia bacterium]
MSDKWPGLERGVFSHKGLKIAALVLAVITWFAVHKAIRFETEVDDIPITILVDQGWAVLERSADTVNVRFRGAQEDILPLRADTIQAVIDIKGQSFEGTRTIEIEPKHVRVHGAARPVLIRPKKITLRLDQEAEKLVPVKVDMKGTASPGYEIEKVEISPLSVMLRGPSKLIENIHELRTKPIDIEGRVQSFKIRTDFLSPSTDWVGYIDPEKVTVDVTFVERSTYKSFEQVSLHVLMNPGISPSVTINPAYVQIKIKGRSEVVESLEQDWITAYVDGSSLKSAARYQLPVRVHAPTRIIVESIVPDTVDISIGDL